MYAIFDHPELNNPNVKSSLRNLPKYNVSFLRRTNHILSAMSYVSGTYGFSEIWSIPVYQMPLFIQSNQPFVKLRTVVYLRDHSAEIAKRDKNRLIMLKTLLGDALVQLTEEQAHLIEVYSLKVKNLREKIKIDHEVVKRYNRKKKIVKLSMEETTKLKLARANKKYMKYQIDINEKVLAQKLLRSCSAEQHPEQFLQYD